MKILLSTRFSPRVGGIESLAAMLVPRWVSSGNQVVVITDAMAPMGFDSQYEFTVFRNPSPRQIRGVAKDCDVVSHFNLSLRAWFPTIGLGKPLVISHQSWYGVGHGSDPMQERFKRWLIRKGASGSISCSRAVRLSLGCDGEVIANAYDDQRFRLMDAERDRDIIFVGRLVSDKGCETLLLALMRLADIGMRPTATIVGDGPERPKLELLIRDCKLNEQVELLGNRSHEELPALLNRHHIQVVPSIWNEPFGIVALEGAACGCVVVGSDGGGLPEAIGPCGRTFPNGDFKALAKVLSSLLTDTAQMAAFRQASTAHLAMHHADIVADRYLEVFRRVICRA